MYNAILNVKKNNQNAILGIQPIDSKESWST